MDKVKTDALRSSISWRYRHLHKGKCHSISGERISKVEKLEDRRKIIEESIKIEAAARNKIWRILREICLLLKLEEIKG